MVERSPSILTHDEKNTATILCHRPDYNVTLHTIILSISFLKLLVKSMIKFRLVTAGHTWIFFLRPYASLTYNYHRLFDLLEFLTLVEYRE